MSRRSKRTGRTQPPARGSRRHVGAAALGDRGAAVMPQEVNLTARRLATQTCGWCGEPIAVKATGRLPKWCSPSCRQRAWEQSRAAASGLAAVRVIERLVEVPKPIAPRRHDWPHLLRNLARQLEDGRIYDRDLLALADALNAVHAAYNRRPFVRSLTSR
jgi:hypothetical protein